MKLKQLINEIVDSIESISSIKAEILLEKKISSNYRACMALNKKLDEEKTNLHEKIELAFKKTLDEFDNMGYTNGVEIEEKPMNEYIDIQAQDSSGLWRTYRSTVNTSFMVTSAMRELQENFPERRIRAVDTNGKIVDIL